MELAVRGGASSTGRMVRLKVCFEDDRSILTPQQVLDGLSASWFVARPDSRTIADLVTDIAHSFNLSMTCPHGIFLQMENFTLPPLQPIWLLKDKDIVIVKKKSRGAMQSEKLGNCSSLGDSDSIDKKGTVGVKSRAIEEFEKEIGGYESEEEEEEDGGEIPPESLEAKNTTNPKSKAKKKKRRKQEIEGGTDQERDLRLQVVPFTGRGSMNEKKSKRKRSAIEPARQEKQALSTQKSHKPKKDKKTGEESMSSGETYEVHKKKRRVSMQSKNSYEKMSVDSTALCTNKTPCSNGEKEKSEGEEIGLESGAAVKKPSRSTLRKKAKRRWKIEQQKALMTQNQESPSKGLAFSDEVKTRSFSFPTRNEEDGDAEEEKLPIVVRPGHIRFEHSDEDDGNHKNMNVAVPSFAWDNGMSKRKGQSWGQEKAHTSKNGKSTPECLMETSTPIDVAFDSLPVLKSLPQEGDVLAYRLVEVAPSKCPELSEYRVGKVADIESQLGMLKLVEDPDYPIEINWEDPSLCPYNEDGSLEIQWSLLVDVRLVKGDLCGKRGVSESMSKGNPESTLVDVPVLALQSTPELSLCTISKPPSSDANQHKDQPPGVLINPAWYELAAVLEKKREELSKGGPISTEEENKRPCLEQLKRSIQNSGAESITKVNNGRSKSWLKKAGGLGSTVALLRTQNVL